MRVHRKEEKKQGKKETGNLDLELALNSQRF